MSSDADLVARVRAGEVDAFRILVERYLPMVRSVAWTVVEQPETVEDLVQETLLQAWVSLHGLRDAARFKSWLYGIALNVGRNWRRRKPLAPLPLDEGNGGVADPYDALEMHWLVEQAVEDLSVGTQAVMRLFYYADLSLDEVAGRLDLSPVVVKSRLHKGRHQLYRRLAAVWPERARAASRRRGKRGFAMIEVRIARVLMVASRLLVVLVDQGGERIVPLWLRHDEAWALVSSTDFAAGLLRATGTRITAVHIGRLHDGLYATDVNVETPSGDTSVHARLGEGLVLAQQHGERILISEELFVTLGISVTEHGSLQEAVEAAITRAGVRGPQMPADADTFQTHVGNQVEPRNLRFTDGLKHWDLRGSFLRDASSAHWQDYSCGTDESGGYLVAQVPEPFGFARLRQAVMADAYRGGRVRLEADIKSAGVTDEAGLFLRVVDPDHHIRSAGRHQDLLQGTHDWVRAQVEAEVPDDAVFILFGITLTGPGQVWLNNVALGRIS